MTDDLIERLWTESREATNRAVAMVAMREAATEIARLKEMDALNEAVIVAVEKALDMAGAPRRSGSLVLGLPARIAALEAKDAEIARLTEALEFAADRLDAAAVHYDHQPFHEYAEWAEQARAALTGKDEE
jgi:hypothetical protein